jgi:hypothetical protein
VQPCLRGERRALLRLHHRALPVAHHAALGSQEFLHPRGRLRAHLLAPPAAAGAALPAVPAALALDAPRELAHAAVGGRRLLPRHQRRGPALDVARPLRELGVVPSGMVPTRTRTRTQINTQIESI